MCMNWNEPPKDFPNSFVARYAIDKLKCAHMYLMKTGNVWYNKDTKEADSLICIAMSNVRKEWITLGKAYTDSSVAVYAKGYQHS